MSLGGLQVVDPSAESGEPVAKGGSVRAERVVVERPEHDEMPRRPALAEKVGHGPRRNGWGSGPAEPECLRRGQAKVDRHLAPTRSTGEKPSGRSVFHGVVPGDAGNDVGISPGQYFRQRKVREG